MKFFFVFKTEGKEKNYTSGITLPCEFEKDGFVFWSFVGVTVERLEMSKQKEKKKIKLVTGSSRNHGFVFLNIFVC